ncbi:MAG TPA: zf-HC2 domain-containing protein [Myxococcaceae bacterium]|nr:zf-HC2 domain-containing protein [Myxococcaceae bacterium]
MSCTFEEDLTAYVDRELPSLEAHRLEAHLPTCQSCASTLALLRRTVSALEAMPAFAPSPALRRAVLTRISEEPPSLLDRLRGLLRPSLLVPALSAAALLAVGVAVVQLSRKGEGPAADAPLMVADATEYELAKNLDLVEDLDVVGLESPEDLEVVEHLDELEGQP